MALSSLLNDKNLARFRTKACERLMTKGHCSFGDRCQYSHADVARRNPKKTIYSSELCPLGRCCVRGDVCPMAHTKEEQLYHPEFYKTRACELGGNCKEYYCPFSHGKDDLRTKAELHAPGALPKADRDTPSPPADAAGDGPVAPEGWWFVGDQKDLLVSRGEVVQNFYGRGHQICGGIVRQGQLLLKEKPGCGPCAARLLSTSRGDSSVANRVIKDIRRWMAQGRSPVLLIRRTVATTVLALPADLRSLDAVVNGRSCGGVGACAFNQTALAAKWLSQITSQLVYLHSTLRVAHMCLGPCSIFLDPTVGCRNEMQLGDFLGKVQYLKYAQSGFSNKDDEWAMWYPAEVHAKMSQEGSLVPGGSNEREDQELDEFAVDAWQLGVVAFFMLTGEHPFGGDATVVCGNITAHRVANWGKLEDFPLWADLIGRLLSHAPEDRQPLRDVLKHPLFWTFEEACTFAKPLLAESREATGTTGPQGRRCAWLCHLPCFADFAVAGQAPPKPPPQMLARICAEALKGKKPKELVHLLQPTAAVAQAAQAMPPILEAPSTGALRDAFDAGALAGACGVYAAGVYAAMAAPPGLWPPAPWVDVASQGLPATIPATQDLFPGPQFQTWDYWRHFPRERLTWLEEPTSWEAPEGTSALDLSFFSTEPGVVAPRETEIITTPKSKPRTPRSVSAEKMRETRDERVKETLGSLLNLLDKCDEAWPPSL